MGAESLDPMLDDIVTHRNADAWYRSIQRRLTDQILRPYIAAEIDRAYADGTLPLPPLGWGRTEIWYLGDLA